MARAAKDSDIEPAIELLMEGKTVTQAASELNINRGSLAALLINNDSARARAHEARIVAAEANQALAEQALKDIQADDTKATVARQRELASHYRWAAKISDPRRYGDKVQQEITGKDGAPLFGISIDLGDK